jgi:hypothetical protein
MVNLTLEDDFIPFRKIRSLLVFIRAYRVYPRLIFSFCTNLAWRDLVLVGKVAPDSLACFVGKRGAR